MDAAVKIRIELSDEELEGLADVARRRGHKNITEYVRYLVNEDAVRHDEASPVDDDEMHILESFREAWGDAMNGRGRPAREVLAELEEDEQS